MNNINFAVSEESHKLILAIAGRATRADNMIDCVSLIMDLSATHANGCELRLAELLEAQQFDFEHDVYGIMNHLNRETGKLDDSFLPRYAK